jgi:hypothetical protein
MKLQSNFFLKYLLYKAKESFLEDRKIWSMYINRNVLRENLEIVIKKILSEKLELKNVRTEDFQLHRYSQEDNLLENEVRFFFKKFLNKWNLSAKIKKVDAFVWTIFVDSSNNRTASKNFKNVLKTLTNSNLVNYSLVIRFFNKSTLLKQEFSDTNKYTVLDIYIPKKYNYGDFLNIVLILFKMLPPELLKKSYLWLVDDDAQILNCNKINNHLDNLLIDLQTGRYFVSGECVDNRYDVSIFHNYVNFPYKQNLIYLFDVPYTRGGGGGL